MVFGVGVGDFVAVGGLCWKVYKKCKDSSSDFAQLSSEVGSLHNILKETEEVSSQQVLTPEQRLKLTRSLQGCENVLKELDKLLTKYERMGTKARRAIDRVGFGMQDMTAIRLKLISNITILDAFNNVYANFDLYISSSRLLTYYRSSNTRLEKKLNLIIAEIRSGQREGSIISARTFDTTAQNEKQTWEGLRKELEDVGISSAVIIERRQFIIEWFQKAVAAGELDEVTPSDDGESVISLYESVDPGVGGDSDLIPIMAMSSLTIEPPTTAEAAMRESPPIFQRLSEPPVDLSPAKSSQDDKSSLLFYQFQLAVEEGDMIEMENLLRKGIDINVQSDGQTALHKTAGRHWEEVVRFLLARGADVHAKDSLGSTALHSAARGKTDCTRLVLIYGADVNAKDSYGATALTSAISSYSEPVMQLLLVNGADLEAKNLNGRTALMEAAYMGSAPIVQFLLEKGADLQAKDLSGATAFMNAAWSGHTPTMQCLLERGADLEAKDSGGMTALKIAQKYQRHEVIPLIRKISKERNRKAIKRWFT